MAFRDIRKSRRRISSEEVGLVVLLILIIGGALALNFYLAQHFSGGEWLYLRWQAIRSFLFEKANPYSAQVAEKVQSFVYGRPAVGAEYHYVLNDPFYLVLLYTPLGIISNFQFARALWMMISEVAIILSIYFALELADWQLPRWLYGFLMVFGLINPLSLGALQSGSVAAVLLCLYLAILVCLRSHYDELAGALLFFVAYQWEVGVLFFAYVIILVFANHRWRVLFGFGMVFVLMMLLSLLIYPGWPLPYIRGVLSDWYRSTQFHFVQAIDIWLPNTDLPIELILGIIGSVVVLLEALGSVQADFRRILWTAALTLAVMPLIGLAVFPSNFVVLVLALCLLVVLVWERWTRYRIFALLLIALLTVLIPLGIYYREMIFNTELYTRLFLILPPLLTILALYWMRWWMFRPARTWMDQLELRR